MVSGYGRPWAPATPEVLQVCCWPLVNKDRVGVCSWGMGLRYFHSLGEFSMRLWYYSGFLFLFLYDYVMILAVPGIHSNFSFPVLISRVFHWTGTRSAKEFGPICFQFNLVNPNLSYNNMSEDCLFVNVYTPDTKPKQLLAVMVWIHGGGYMWGSGDDDFYGPQFLVRQGVVLVTFNYRLEALGFLCLDTDDLPGNVGMKDQVAALKWVKNNIRNFGGNPENITIFGESAGAGSVSYHLMSPMSRGLFQRAILQSGSAACWWAQDIASREKTLLLAKRLGCFSEDDKTLFEFFKKVPIENLINLKLTFSKAQKSYEIHFGIVDEKDFGQERFFYGDVTEVMRRGVHEGVDIMTGYTEDEGLLPLAIGDPLENMLEEAKYFNEFFVPRWMKTHCVLADQLEAGRKMRQFYCKGEDVSEDCILKYLNMDMFVYGVYLAGQIYAQKNKVYLYKFACVSERNFFAHTVGLTNIIKNKPAVAHMDDLAYLFPIKIMTEKVDIGSETFKCIDKVTTLWTNFAKFGNPTPDKSLGVEWRTFDLERRDYLELGNELNMSSAPDKEELEYWEKIFKEHLPSYAL